MLTMLRMKDMLQVLDRLPGRLYEPMHQLRTYYLQHLPADLVNQHAPFGQALPSLGRASYV